MNRTAPLTSLVLAAILAAPALGDSVRLKSSVRMSAGAEKVRLGDIAELDGAEAQQYADLIVAELGASITPLEISVSEVRAKLIEAGAHRGRINLSGRNVIIRPRRLAGATAPEAMTGASLLRGKVKKHAKESGKKVGSAAKKVKKALA